MLFARLKAALVALPLWLSGIAVLAVPVLVAASAVRADERPRLEELAQCIRPKATWEQLRLPEAQVAVLREFATRYQELPKAKRKGMTVLLAGGGTGKTMAAEALAKELRLDLYRIDLSKVVSKYIGETEKNLRRLFDAAEQAGAILFFDEADALFGKRSEVKDGHDRYANLEANTLLQRMEAYEGITLLAASREDFPKLPRIKRIRTVVRFPLPKPE